MREGLAELVAARTDAGTALADHADVIAAACRAMADRFRRGGTLYAVGVGLSASDAQHVAVEFVHPVIVGKRALPAYAVDGTRVAQLAVPNDIVLAIATNADAAPPAPPDGVLTVALSGGHAAPAADYCIHVDTADPLVAKELHVTTYHLLWELVHVFLERDA